MKLGTENRTKVIAAVSLGVVAVVVLGVELSGWLGGASSSAAAPAPSAANLTVNSARRQPSGRSAARKTGNPAQSLDPSLRYDLLKTSEDTKYEGTGRNIFRVFVEIPKPIIQPVTPQPQPEAQGPPPPPPPPPIDLKFYGFATPAGGAKRIFLAKGEDVFIAREGEIVARRYKVMRISPNSVDILDVLSNNRQSIPLTQG